jgi:hypothetical protein
MSRAMSLCEPIPTAPRPAATISAEPALGLACNSNNTGRFLLVHGEWSPSHGKSVERGHRVPAPVQESKASQPTRATATPWRETQPCFACETDRQCAAALDQQGVTWEYRPVTFVLERDEDGQPLETWCPDFYLPEQNVFLELTGTPSERLSATNSRTRKLRQQYPDVDVQQLYRRDVEMLSRRSVFAFLPAPATVLDEAVALVAEA